MPANEVRAITFFTLVLNFVGLIFVNRSFSTSLVAAFTRPNGALLKVLIAVAAMLSTTLLWPAATELLRFGPLHLDDLLVSFAAGLGLVVGLEAIETVCRRIDRD